MTDAGSEGAAELLDALACGTSRTEIADRLGVAVEDLRDRIDRLRERGFEIEEADGGYVVRSVPEYGGDAVAFGLDAPYRIEFHDRLPSTNDRARELATAGEPADKCEGVVVVAERQTGGKGRRDRRWSSPAGGIYASVLLRPDLEPSAGPLYTFAAAVAIARACRQAGVDARIKWPNDVLVGDDGPDSADRHGRGGRKLAGILTESAAAGDRLSWLIVGMGVNANVDADALPPDATSLAAEVGAVNRRRFLQAVLEEFRDLTTDPDAVIPAWREYAATLGTRVRIKTPSDVVEGEAVDVRPTGELVVRTTDGDRVVAVGDCEHLRSA